MTMLHSDAAHALLIFGLAFVLEDVAVLGAALLVVNSMVSLPWAAGSSFAGIWFGDLGLYFLGLQLGRPVLDEERAAGTAAVGAGPQVAGPRAGRGGPDQSQQQQVRRGEASLIRHPGAPRVERQGGAGYNTPTR